MGFFTLDARELNSGPRVYSQVLGLSHFSSSGKVFLDISALFNVSKPVSFPSETESVFFADSGKALA